MRRTSTLTVAASILAILGACSPEQAQPDRADRDSFGVYWNGVYWNGVYWNGLLGTPENIEELRGLPLGTTTFDPSQGGSVNLSLQLEDPASQAVMSYLVSCALGPNQKVEWTSGSGESIAWRGQIGLCPAWNTGAPSVACQEMVSSCMLARNNPAGTSVAIRLATRKLDGTAMELAATVPAKPIDSEGNVIASTKSCGVGMATANCGWHMASALVGTCKEGTSVKLGCGTLKATELRVCEGPEACDAADAIASGTCNTHFIKKTQFACNRGSFTLMQRGKDAGTGKPKVPVNAIYPASELEVFSLREAAWTGNLFDSTKRNDEFTRTVDASGRIRETIPSWYASGPITIFEDAFACAGSHYGDDEAAYMYHRMCGFVSLPAPYNMNLELCAAESLGTCDAPAPTNICGVDDNAPLIGDKDFADCLDGNNRKRAHSITTFLDDGCAMTDVIRDANDTIICD